MRWTNILSMTNGPWGQGPRPGGAGGGKSGPRQPGGGGNPPDLDEFLRKGQEKVRQLFPQESGGGSKGLVILGLAIGVLWLASGIYRVEPDEKGVVLRFGEFHHQTDPGLRYHLPSPIETVLKPQVTRVNRVEIGFRSPMDGREGAPRAIAEESLMLTGDENIVDINFEVQWKIRDAKDYLFNIRMPEVTVKNAAESAMREVIGLTPIATAMSEGRLAIEVSARKMLQEMLDSYNSGIEVVRLQMLKVDPPAAVIDAFRDVQTARADQERLINQAESYRNDIIPRARGAAEQKLLDAEAYKQQKTAQADGEAARFMSVYNEYKQAKTVTRQRLYIETMESVLHEMNKVVVDEDVKGIVPFLPLGELNKKPASSDASQQ